MTAPATRTHCPTCGQALPGGGGLVHVLQLPFARPTLGLNDRKDRRGVDGIAANTAQVRRASATVCRAAKLGSWSLIRVCMFWRPGLEWGKPSRRRTRDHDNLIATSKPACDGLVDAGLVPDDDPAHMQKLMPVITDPDNTRPGRLWLEVELIDR